MNATEVSEALYSAAVESIAAEWDLCAADLEVFVDEVEFASAIPALADLSAEAFALVHDARLRFHQLAVLGDARRLARSELIDCMAAVHHLKATQRSLIGALRAAREATPKGVA